MQWVALHTASQAHGIHAHISSHSIDSNRLFMILLHKHTCYHHWITMTLTLVHRQQHHSIRTHDYELDWAHALPMPYSALHGSRSFAHNVIISKSQSHLPIYIHADAQLSARGNGKWQKIKTKMTPTDEWHAFFHFHAEWKCLIPRDECEFVGKQFLWIWWIDDDDDDAHHIHTVVGLLHSEEWIFQTKIDYN